MWSEVELLGAIRVSPGENDEFSILKVQSHELEALWKIWQLLQPASNPEKVIHSVIILYLFRTNLYF